MCIKTSRISCSFAGITQIRFSGYISQIIYITPERFALTAAKNMPAGYNLTIKIESLVIV